MKVEVRKEDGGYRVICRNMGIEGWFESLEEAARFAAYLVPYV